MGKCRVSVDSTDSEGDTPLHVMVWRKDRYAVRLLIEAGANVNAIGDMGETPLHIAVAREEPEIVELLLKAGANIHIRSEFNITPLGSAAEKGGALEKLFQLYART
jgi:ankyrin repeat protein